MVSETWGIEIKGWTQGLACGSFTRVNKETMYVSGVFWRAVVRDVEKDCARMTRGDNSESHGPVVFTCENDGKFITLN